MPVLKNLCKCFPTTNVTKVVPVTCVESFYTVAHTQTQILAMGSGWWQVGKLAKECSQRALSKI